MLVGSLSSMCWKNHDLPVEELSSEVLKTPRGPQCGAHFQGNGGITLCPLCCLYPGAPAGSMGEGEARSSSSPPIPEVILGAVLGGTGAG